MEAVMAKHKPYTSKYKLQTVLDPDGLGSLKLAQTEGIAQTRPTFTSPGNTALTEQEKENQQLRRDLEIARQERNILKKLWPVLTIQQHLTGLVASLPKRRAEIQIHPQAPQRIRSRNHVPDAQGEQKRILRIMCYMTKKGQNLTDPKKGKP
jgi:hypothetical protein